LGVKRSRSNSAINFRKRIARSQNPNSALRA
jgi:hypothetical protein